MGDKLEESSPSGKGKKGKLMDKRRSEPSEIMGSPKDGKSPKSKRKTPLGLIKPPGLAGRSVSLSDAKSRQPKNRSAASTSSLPITSSSPPGRTSSEKASHYFKSKQETEEDEALAEIKHLLAANRPKHIGQGLTSGVGYILQGAVGAAGIALLQPGVAAVEGKERGGIVGGLVGGVGGVVGGVFNATNVMAGGLVSGVGQVVRGAAATPNAIIQPSRGKWWNANEGKWVLTDLSLELEWIQQQPKFDEDILGDDVIPEDERPPKSPEEEAKSKVKDPYYYDLLKVDPSVDAALIKRRYYIIARKYSPDRCGNNAKAMEEFQEITNAYMVLSNPETREKYDKFGRKGMQNGGEDDDDQPKVDPQMLYSVLFGSEKFHKYFGRLAAVSSARVGDESSSKISFKEGRLLQKRRVTRLALALAERLLLWVDDNKDGAKSFWKSEAENLNGGPYGSQLLKVIGKVYSVVAVQFLGSIESGIGMPSISKWAKKQQESMVHATKSTAKKVKNMAGDMDRIRFESRVSQEFDETHGDLEETRQKLKPALRSKAVKILWTQTVVDITNTVHEAAQMVLHDQDVPPDVRKKRGKGLAVLGEIFQQAKKVQVNTEDEEPGMESIAFYAMLDTVWRQEEATSHAQQATQSNQQKQHNTPTSQMSPRGGRK